MDYLLFWSRHPSLTCRPPMVRFVRPVAKDVQIDYCLVIIFSFVVKSSIMTSFHGMRSSDTQQPISSFLEAQSSSYNDANPKAQARVCRHRMFHSLECCISRRFFVGSFSRISCFVFFFSFSFPRVANKKNTATTKHGGLCRWKRPDLYHCQ